ncbi:PLP-dependent aminotransferase family protein [Bradyrhizobium sp. UFLA06-06]
MLAQDGRELDGRKLIDFLSSAGALNHQVKIPITEYLASDAVVRGLDLATPAKIEFMETLSSIILRERNLHYRLQFTGPTGANAIEAALKRSRKVTGRQNIISFTHGYRGTSLEAIAAGGNRLCRAANSVPRSGPTFMPFDGYLGPADTADDVRTVLMDESSGIGRPAAILVELCPAALNRYWRRQTFSQGQHMGELLRRRLGALYPGTATVLLFEGGAWCWGLIAKWSKSQRLRHVRHLRRD